MIVTILITVSVTLWCLFSFVLYGYRYLLEVILDFPLIGESPCTAHSALKLIIQKIIREANDLPKLRTDGTFFTPEGNNRTYENLLSAAILNKIISNSQNNVSPGSCSSRANSVCSHISSSSRNNPRKEYFFGEETLEDKWKNIDVDTASSSSLEEWVHSDSSLGSTKYVDRISLTIKQCIDEVSSSESDQENGNVEEDEENIEYSRPDSSSSNNKPNWFLQRKQFIGGSTSPVPVPMLVPNPTIEAKVLIGDKEVDETSDLSDVPSDLEDEKQDSLALMDVKNHLIHSRSIIGGKNPLIDFSHMSSDDEVSADSGVKECKDLYEMDSETSFISNKHKKDYSALEEIASIHSEDSNNERDTEYTERYATLPRQISITPKVQSQDNHDGKSQKYQEKTVDLEEENEYEFAGLYSKREKQKWKNAVELENNPYSKENIEKRIRSRNSINSLFGNDYYIKQASLPSGAKRPESVKANPIYSGVPPLIDEKLSEIESEEKRLGELSNEVTKAPKDNSPIDTSKIPSVSDGSQLKSCEYKQEISDSELQFSEMNSDSDVSLVNCYNIPQSVIYRKICADNEEIQTAEKFLGNESLEDFSNVTEEPKEQFKPVVKPRTRLKKNVPVTSNVKVPKVENFNEGDFNTIPYIIDKKPDNTLIKKIYSNPNVRLFAFNNRNKLPISMERSSIKTPVTCNAKPSSQTPKKFNTKEVVNNNIFPEDEIITSTPMKDYIPQITEMYKRNIFNNGDDTNLIFEKSNLEIQNDKNNNLGSCEALEEISKLKQQKLVANRINEFSKSFENLSQIYDNCQQEDITFGLSREKNLSTTSEDRYVGRRLSGLQKNEKSASVKDLRRIFEQFNVSKKEDKPILYSLTGRSISKQMKEKLRDLDEQTSLS